MSGVIVGVDPHKKSVTIEAVDEHGQVLATGRFATDSTGYRLMLRYVRDQWPHRRWAVEGAQGVGRPLAQRLLAQGETVLDVPAKPCRLQDPNGGPALPQNAESPTRSTANSWPTPPLPPRRRPTRMRAREGTRGRL
jgi:hypothetical protein